MFVAHLIIDAPDILVFVRDTPGPVEDLPARVVRRQVDPSEDLQRRSSVRSEEHTSELQSPCNLVCRLLLEKKKKTPSPSLSSPTSTSSLPGTQALPPLSPPAGYDPPPVNSNVVLDATRARPTRPHALHLVT